MSPPPLLPLSPPPPHATTATIAAASAAATPARALLTETLIVLFLPVRDGSFRWGHRPAPVRVPWPSATTLRGPSTVRRAGPMSGHLGSHVTNGACVCAGVPRSRRDIDMGWAEGAELRAVFGAAARTRP